MVVPPAVIVALGQAIVLYEPDLPLRVKTRVNAFS